jgi:hypothetical protein
MSVQLGWAWLCRYGGYLGLKYLLAARVDDRRELLPLALPILTAGLQVRVLCFLEQLLGFISMALVGFRAYSYPGSPLQLAIGPGT